ncbi:MAG: hypothetical protein IPG69_00285 [Flavobacteriales bacterium]|nr:hypothetical protein [Flavobacteriales bacterium]
MLPLLAAGQERTDLFPRDTSSCTRIIAKGGYEMDANAIYNELLLGLVNGGYLERELRQRSSDALSGMNRLGQVFQVRATVIAGIAYSTNRASNGRFQHRIRTRGACASGRMCTTSLSSATPPTRTARRI